MLDSLNRCVTYLRDPFLVRRIQEALGVREIKNTTACDPQTNKKDHGTVDWLVSNAIKVRRRLKTPPDSATPVSSPEPPDIECECISFVDVYFRIAKEFGYEPFYITFFPILFWNVDSYVARHATFMWCASMYIGQAMKALVKWKRPSCPPAIRLEQNSNLETEYGFPSTHAIVSTTVPFYCLYMCWERYEVKWLGLWSAHNQYVHPPTHSSSPYPLASSPPHTHTVPLCHWIDGCHNMVAVCMPQQVVPWCPHSHGKGIDK